MFFFVVVRSNKLLSIASCHSQSIIVLTSKCIYYIPNAIPVPCQNWKFPFKNWFERLFTLNKKLLQTLTLTWLHNGDNKKKIWLLKRWFRFKITFNFLPCKFVHIWGQEIFYSFFFSAERDRNKIICITYNPVSIEYVCRMRTIHITKCLEYSVVNRHSTLDTRHCFELEILVKHEAVCSKFFTYLELNVIIVASICYFVVVVIIQFIFILNFISRLYNIFIMTTNVRFITVYEISCTSVGNDIFFSIAKEEFRWWFVVTAIES